MNITGIGEEQLKTLLRSNILKVTFTKLDKSIRVMVCTLMSELISTPLSISTARSGLPITVWDIEAQGWRSMKPENIISVEKLN